MDAQSIAQSILTWFLFIFCDAVSYRGTQAVHFRNECNCPILVTTTRPKHLIVQGSFLNYFKGVAMFSTFLHDTLAHRSGVYFQALELLNTERGLPSMKRAVLKVYVPQESIDHMQGSS